MFIQAGILSAEINKNEDSEESTAQDKTKHAELIKSFKNLGDYLEGIKMKFQTLRSLGVLNKEFSQNFTDLIKGDDKGDRRKLFDRSVVKSDTHVHTRLLFKVMEPETSWSSALKSVNDDLGTMIESLEKSTKTVLNSVHAMTYFSGPKMYFLLEMLKKIVTDRNSPVCLNTKALLEQNNDGLELNQKMFQDIGVLEDTTIQNSIEDAGKLLESNFKINQKGFYDETNLLSKNCVTVINVKPSSNGEKSGVNGFELLLQLFCQENSQQLLLMDMFNCEASTDTMAVDAFLSRCFTDTNGRVYSLLSPASLEASVLDHLFKKIEDAFSAPRSANNENSKLNNRLIIFNDMETGDKFSNKVIFETVALEGFKATMKLTNYRGRYTDKLSKVTVVTSALANEGKTHYIKKAHLDSKVDKLLELSLSGEVSTKLISDRLATLAAAALKLGNMAFNLHVKLDYVEHFKQNSNLIDWILFNLCFFRMHECESGIQSYKNRLNHVFVEVGNSIPYSEIKANIWTVDLLEEWSKEHSHELVIKDLFQQIPGFANCPVTYDSNWDSDLQVAAKHLLEYDRSKLVLGSSTDKALLKEAEFHGIIKKYYQLPNEVHKNKKTFGSFLFWIKCIATCRRGLDCWITEKIAKASADDKKYYENLFTEVGFEIVNSALNLLQLQDNGASDCQDLIKQILDKKARESKKEQKDLNGQEGEKDEETGQLTNKLIDNIAKSVWNTDHLLLFLVDRQGMLPVYSNETAIRKQNEKSKNMAASKSSGKEEDQQLDNIAKKLSTRKFIADISKEFSQGKKDQEDSVSNSKHKYYAYQLAIMCVGNLDGNGTNAIREKYEKIETSTQSFTDSKDDHENANKKGFSITEEVFVKLALMKFKASIKAPILIMGESGCGKTYLTQFLVQSLLGDELLMQTLHSGYAENRLIVFILHAIRYANYLKAQNKNKNLWIFFDEFNTTAIQSLIADVMLDRTSPQLGSITDIELQEAARSLNPDYKDRAAEAGKDPTQDELDYQMRNDYRMKLGEATSLSQAGIPDNVLFIACCNPFRIKLIDNSADIGLIPNEQSSVLSHVVHPIPKRLLAHVWDFGQLSDKDEKEHIQNQIRTQQFFKTNLTGEVTLKGKHPEGQNLPHDLQNKKNHQFTILVDNCHKLVREIEERSGVSLRDMNRVYIFFRWFSQQLRLIKKYFNKLGPLEKATFPEVWMLASPLLQDIGAAVCTMIICYGLRLNGQDTNLGRLYDCITDWANYVSKLKIISKTDVQASLCQLAKVYLHGQENIIQDVALNRPLLENFITLLACYHNKVPMIIIGAPGTSKTLSTNLFIQLLAKTLTVPELLKNFNEANSIYFSGSQSSTAEAVERVFKKADDLYKKDHFITPQNNQSGKPAKEHKTQVIFFDEIGLAELSPYNPLKVMHSYLEKNLGKIMFIGISNWKPDQSKLNRMICLARPDIAQEDIQIIFLNSLSKITNEKATIIYQILLNALASAYLKYRNWQKQCNQKNNMYHGNFHGSRDIYATFKLINSEVPKQRFDELTDNQTIFDAAFNIAKTAIERNLNGEVYLFERQPQNSSDLVDSRHIFLQSLFSESQGSSSNRWNNLKQLILTEGFCKKHEIIRLDDLEDVYGKQDVVKSRGRSTCLTSSEVFKIIFMDQLSKLSHNLDGIDPKRAAESVSDSEIEILIRDSIKNKESRFVMIRTESLITEDIFMTRLAKIEKERNRDPEMIIDWRLPDNATGKDNISDLLSLFKTYVSKGYTVVMKNLDDLYGALYELFNQKYTKNGDKSSCYLYYGEIKQMVEIHKDFKCVVILPAHMTVRTSKDLEKKQPAPFLNRFEKYYLHMETILGAGDMDKLIKARKIATDLMGNNGKLNLPAMNIDLLASMMEKGVMDKTEDLKLNERLKDKILQLASFNVMTSDASVTTESFLKAKDITGDSNNLKSILTWVGNNKQKVMLLTFSKVSELSDADFACDDYRPTVKRVSDLKWERMTLSGSPFKDEKTDLSFLVLVFESPRDISHLHQLKTMIGRYAEITSVVFVVHMSKYADDRKVLRENNGISFCNGWNVWVLDSLQSKFQYSTIMGMLNLQLGKVLEGSTTDPMPDANDPSSNNESDNEISGEAMMTSDVLRHIIVKIWPKVTEKSALEAGVEMDVAKLTAMLGLQDAEKSILPNLKISLSNYLVARNDSQVKMTLADAIRDSFKDDISMQNYKTMSQLLSVALEQKLREHIINYFALLNKHCHNFYTRMHGMLEEDSRHIVHEHMKLFEEALKAAEAGTDLSKLLERKTKTVQSFYSPLSQKDLELMDNIVNPDRPLSSFIMFKSDQIVVLGRQLVKTIAVANSKDANKLSDDEKGRLASTLSTIQAAIKVEEVGVLNTARRIANLLAPSKSQDANEDEPEVNDRDSEEDFDDDISKNEEPKAKKPTTHLSFGQHISEDEQEEIGVCMRKLAIDILQFVFNTKSRNAGPKMVDAIFSGVADWDNLNGFLKICYEITTLGGKEATLMQNESMLVKALTVPLFMCLSHKEIVKGLSSLMANHGLKAEDIVKFTQERLKQETTEAEGEANNAAHETGIINFRAIQILNDYINLKGIRLDVNSKLFTLDLIRKRVDISNQFMNDYKMTVGTLFSMIGYLPESKANNHINGLQNLHINSKNSDIVLPDLLRLGLKVYQDVLAEKANLAKTKSADDLENSEQITGLIKDFLREWTWQLMGFDMLLGKEYSLLFNAAVFSDEEFVQVMIGVSKSIYKMLGDTNSAISTDHLLAIVRGDVSATYGISAVRRLVDSWAEKKDSRFRLAIKCVHDNLATSMRKDIISSNKPKADFSVAKFMEVVAVYQNWTGTFVNLQFLLSSVCFWLQIGFLKDKDLSSMTGLETLDSLFIQGLTTNNAEDYLSNKLSYPLFTFLKQVYLKDNNVNRVQSKMKTAQVINEGMVDKNDNAKIGLSNLAYIQDYNQVVVQLESSMMQANSSGSPAQLVSVIAECSKTPLKIYLLGVSLINNFVTASQPNNQVEAYKKNFAAARSSFANTSSLENRFCMLAINLLNMPATKYSESLTGAFEVETESNLRKIIAHQALVVLCFPTDGLKYKGDEWKQWTECVLQDNFYAKSCVEAKLKRSVFSLDDVLFDRMVKLAEGWWPYGSYKKNIGLYMCKTCGLLFHYQNCGYVETSYPKGLFDCEYCGKKVGGMTHGYTMLSNESEKIEPENLQRGIDFLKKNFERDTRRYIAHDRLESSCTTHMVLRQVEIPLKEFLNKSTKGAVFNEKLFSDFHRDVYIRHLFDHLYLLSLPLLMDPADQPKLQTAIQKSMSIKPGKIGAETHLFLDEAPDEMVRRSADDYLMQHVKRDLEEIKSALKLDSIFQSVEWLRSLHSQMANMILTKASWDKQTRPPMPAIALTDAKGLIKTESSNIGKMISAAADSLPVKLRHVLTGLKPLSEVAVVPESSKYFQLYESLELKTFFDLEAAKKAFKAASNYYTPIVKKCIKYDGLLREFPKMMGTLVSLIRFIHRKYSGKLSLEDLRNAHFMRETKQPSDTKLPSDPTLVSLYKDFKTTWDIVRNQGFADEYSDIFEIGFMCQRNIDFNQYLRKVTTPDEVALIDFTLHDMSDESVDNSMIITSGLLQTLIEKLHNPISNSTSYTKTKYRDEDEGETEEVASQVLKSIKVCDALEKDFTTLNSDINQLILDSVTVEPNLDVKSSAYVVDLHTIQITCLREVSRPMIMAEPNNGLVTFKCSEAINNEERLTLKKRLEIMPSEPQQLTAKTKDYLKSDQFKKDAELNKLMRFISKLGHYMYVNMDLSNADEGDTSIKEMLVSKGIDADSKLDHDELKREVEQLKFPQAQVKVNQLSKLYAKIQKMHLKSFFDKCDKPISEDAKSSLKKQFSSAAEAAKKLMAKGLDEILKSMKDSIVSLYNGDNYNFANDPVDTYSIDFDLSLLPTDFKDDLKLGNYCDLKKFVEGLEPK